MDATEVSVAVGFRDWGVDRVRRCAQSIIAGLEGLRGELIISDYGSAEPEPVRALAEELGTKYVYTPSPVWSRSRALNAGIIVHSRGVDGGWNNRFMGGIESQIIEGSNGDIILLHPENAGGNPLPQSITADVVQVTCTFNN